MLVDPAVRCKVGALKALEEGSFGIDREGDAGGGEGYCGHAGAVVGIADNNHAECIGGAGLKLIDGDGVAVGRAFILFSVEEEQEVLGRAGPADGDALGADGVNSHVHDGQARGARIVDGGECAADSAAVGAGVCSQAATVQNLEAGLAREAARCPAEAYRGTAADADGVGGCAAAGNGVAAKGFASLDDADGIAVPTVTVAVVKHEGDVAAAAFAVGTAAHGAHRGFFVAAVGGDTKGVARRGLKVIEGVLHASGLVGDGVLFTKQVHSVGGIAVDGVFPSDGDALRGGQAVNNGQVGDGKALGGFALHEAHVVLLVCYATVGIIAKLGVGGAVVLVVLVIVDGLVAAGVEGYERNTGCRTGVGTSVVVNDKHHVACTIIDERDIELYGGPCVGGEVHVAAEHEVASSDGDEVIGEDTVAGVHHVDVDVTCLCAAVNEVNARDGTGFTEFGSSVNLLRQAVVIVRIYRHSIERCVLGGADDNLGGGLEAQDAGPGAHEVAAVGAHHDGVGGLRGQGVEGDGGLGHVDKVVGVAVEGNLPSAGDGVNPSDGGRGGLGRVEDGGQLYGDAAGQRRGEAAATGGSPLAATVFVAADGTDLEFVVGVGEEVLNRVSGILKLYDCAGVGAGPVAEFPSRGVVVNPSHVDSAVRTGEGIGHVGGDGASHGGGGVDKACVGGAVGAAVGSYTEAEAGLRGEAGDGVGIFAGVVKKGGVDNGVIVGTGGNLVNVVGGTAVGGVAPAEGDSMTADVADVKAFHGIAADLADRFNVKLDVGAVGARVFVAAVGTQVVRVGVCAVAVERDNAVGCACVVEVEGRIAGGVLVHGDHQVAGAVILEGLG